MKQLSYILITVIMTLFVLMTACNNDEQLYDGPTYVMFSDSLNLCPVFEDNSIYEVPLAATKSAPYDRHYGVEVLQTKSNAIEGYHYKLKSNTVTIPAGKLATSVEISGIYENIKNSDSLNIRMRIVSLDNIEWDYYGVETNVRFKKICPFSINNFTGYAVVESSFLNNFSRVRKRLITTEKAEDDENGVMLRGLMSDGYDVKITFDNSNPFVPEVNMRTGDIIGITQEFLGTTYNDNVLRIKDYSAVPSTFLTCKNTVVLYSIVYVKDVGNLGVFVTVIRWVSDAEAEDIMENGF